MCLWKSEYYEFSCFKENCDILRLEIIQLSSKLLLSSKVSNLYYFSFALFYL